MQKQELLELLSPFTDIHVENLSCDRVRIRIDARSQAPWSPPIILILAGLLVAGLGFWLPSFIPEEMRHSPMANQARVLPWLGITAAAMGPLLILIRLANGKSRDSILEAHTGTLLADRSIAGDHVVRAYNADEVQSLSVEGGMLYLYTKLGGTQLSSFGPSKAMPAIAMLLASQLWHPEEIVSSQDKIRFMIPGTIAFSSVTQIWFLPRSRIGKPE